MKNPKNQVKVLYKCAFNYLLPESPVFRNNIIYWVDIEMGGIFSSDEHLKKTKCLGKLEHVSALFFCEYKLYAVNKKGIFRIRNDKLCLTPNFNLEIPGDYRTNECSLSENGELCISFMHQENQDKNRGGVIVLEFNSKKVINRISNLGIPNTLLWLSKDTFLMVDSLSSKYYKVDARSDCHAEEVTLNASRFPTATPGVPDGSTRMPNGNILNARYGGGSLWELTSELELIDIYNTPWENSTSVSHLYGSSYVVTYAKSKHEPGGVAVIEL